MIISKIIGGLGNQMFQYAAGRALSIGNEQRLILDISDFDGYELHQGFELQRVFSGSFEIASKVDVRGLLGWQSPSIIQRILVRRPFDNIFEKRVVVEPHFHYWPEIKNVSGNLFLSGYWQSEKYFSNVISQLRSDFLFRLPMGNKNTDLANMINRVNAVSLHVRRGDYVSNSKTHANHGLCSLDYYRAAIRHVSARIENPYFFIFSDEISWVKDNLEMNFPCQYIDHNQGAESYNDMRLMSLCRHHIIANSSFSWWGAWLNFKPEKIVVAPRKWFENDNNVKDLIPCEWTSI